MEQTDADAGAEKLGAFVPNCGQTEKAEASAGSRAACAAVANQRLEGVAFHTFEPALPQSDIVLHVRNGRPAGQMPCGVKGAFFCRGSDPRLAHGQPLPRVFLRWRACACIDWRAHSGLVERPSFGASRCSSGAPSILLRGQLNQMLPTHASSLSPAGRTIAVSFTVLSAITFWKL